MGNNELLMRYLKKNDFNAHFFNRFFIESEHNSDPYQ